MEKLCVFGAGAIGGHIAAQSARAGLDVSVVARGEHLEAIKKNGLRFTSEREEFVVKLRATAEPSEIGKQDLVIVTVKSHTLPHIVHQLLPLLHEKTPVIFAVNGIPWWYFHSGQGQDPGGAGNAPGLLRLDPKKELWNVLGVERALGCVIRSPNEVIAPGVIHSSHPLNKFVIGEPDNSMSPRLNAIIEWLRPALPGVSATSDIRQAIWNKLLLNVAGSPLATITQSPWIDFLDNEEMVRIFRALAAETENIARAYGICLTTTADDMLAAMREVRHPASMLQDLLAGRQLETDALLRAPQDLARQANIQTPVLDIISVLVEQRGRAAMATAKMHA